MLLRQIYDPYLAQYAYLIGCQKTGESLIIDPERDVDRYHELAKDNGLRITAAAETHIHAVFVSGIQELAQDLGLNVYLSDEGGVDWAYQWPRNRSKTHFLKHGDIFFIGKIKIEVLHTPGHTPEHISFLITDIGGGADQPMALITGDFLFVGDVGRPDLLESAAGIKDVMEPSAKTLKISLRERMAKLSDSLQILPAHGAGSVCGKSLGAVPFSTLGYERQFNKPFKQALADDPSFVKDILLGQPNPPLYFARMKRINRDGISVTGGVPKPSKLSPSEFLKLASTPNIRILDTRENQEAFDALHIPNAIQAPLRTTLFSTCAGSFLNDSDKILLVVEREEDVDLATRQLYRIGFDNVLGWISFDKAKANGLASAKIPRVNFSDFNAAEASKIGEIIDVRTTAEFEHSHLKGAHSFPYTQLKLHLNDLPKDRQLFVHCGTGRRAALAASFLNSERFAVTHVDGKYIPQHH